MLILFGFFIKGRAEVDFLDTTLGQEKIMAIRPQMDFWRIFPYLQTQDNLAYCGVASLVLALNYFFKANERPFASQYVPYRYFSQEDFFSPQVSDIITEQKVRQLGITADQMARILESFHLEVSVFPGDSLDEKEFHRILEEEIYNKNSVLLVNFSRKVLGQKGGGHWSPVGGYCSQSRNVFVLDVAPYKSLPFWVSLKKLLKSIDTVDGESGKSRVFLLVKKEIV